jgi:hypothetical protein
MTNKKVETLLTKIKAVRSDLSEVGNMRPGSVTKQLRKRGDKEWFCWQISYTLNGVSKTEYVRDEFLTQIKNEVAEYKRFKNLNEKLVELNVALSKENINLLKENLKK